MTATLFSFSRITVSSLKIVGLLFTLSLDPAFAGSSAIECNSLGPARQPLKIVVEKPTTSTEWTMSVSLTSQRTLRAPRVVVKHFNWKTMKKTQVDKKLRELATKEDPETVTIYGWPLEEVTTYYEYSIYVFFDRVGGLLGKSATYGYWLAPCL